MKQLNQFKKTANYKCHEDIKKYTLYIVDLLFFQVIPET